MWLMNDEYKEILRKVPWLMNDECKDIFKEKFLGSLKNSLVIAQRKWRREEEPKSM
jgi:hypothetical protein